MFLDWRGFRQTACAFLVMGAKICEVWISLLLFAGGFFSRGTLRTWMIWLGSREFIVVPLHAWTWRGIKLAWFHRALWQNDSHVHFVLDTDTHPVCLMVMFTANYNNIKTSKESHDGSFGPFPHNIFSCCFVSPTPQLQTRETLCLHS